MTATDRTAVLALDTAGPGASAALSVGGADPLTHVAEAERARGEHLCGGVQALLDRAGLGAADLGAIAVVSGPGSYTGLRVGLALAKGLALVDRLPVVAVGSLELTANWAAPEPGPAVALVRAHAGRWYAADFEVGAAVAAAGDPELVEAGRLAGFLGARSAATAVCVGDHEADDAREAAGATAPDVAWRVAGGLRVSVLCRLGQQELARGRAADASTLVPVYVGSSGAKRNTNRVATFAKGSD